MRLHRRIMLGLSGHQGVIGVLSSWVVQAKAAIRTARHSPRGSLGVKPADDLAHERDRIVQTCAPWPKDGTVIQPLAWVCRSTVCSGDTQGCYTVTTRLRLTLLRAAHSLHRASVFLDPIGNQACSWVRL
jgi:hypothetical protein